MTGANNKGKVIIGVDDNAVGLQLLDVTLTSHGYTFFGAQSGAECIDLAHRIKPALFILDVQMPEMDGFETCRRLRKMLAPKDIPIIFLTACNTGEEVRAALDAGGKDFLVKPIVMTKLIERVRHWA